MWFGPQRKKRCLFSLCTLVSRLKALPIRALKEYLCIVGPAPCRVDARLTAVGNRPPTLLHRASARSSPTPTSLSLWHPSPTTTVSLRRHITAECWDLPECPRPLPTPKAHPVLPDIDIRLLPSKHPPCASRRAPPPSSSLHGAVLSR